MACKKSGLILYLFLLTGLWQPVFATEAFPGEANTSTCNTIEYYYRMGCPHCYRARIFLDQLHKERPDIIIRPFNILDKGYGERRFLELNDQYEVQRPGVPSFLVCDHFIIGFDTPGSTGSRIKSLLVPYTEMPVIAGSPSAEIHLPGNISVNKYGLPLFTIIIGLIDGFNPCAMWILLFLLALLINLHSRLRIIAVAGTFVLVSGIVYFTFMAAWLNLFLIIGFSRTLQVAVGVIAIIIGTIHIKDYFAFRKGISLSIPETAKPGIYAKMRKVVYAENLAASMIAVIILAILVNLVELICTAGLPAAYTQILTLQGLPGSEYYAYLVLYNIAYIFDDALAVAIVVYTLSRTRLQEKAGRILKLISGTIVAALGIYLLFFPDMLI